MKFLLIFLLAASLTAAPTFVQSVSDRSATSTVVEPFGSNVVAGNLLIVGVVLEAGSGATVSSITDSQGNTYTAVAAQVNSSTNVGVRVYYTLAASSAADEVTVVVSSGAVGISIHEYSGVPATVNVSSQSFGVNDSGGTATSTDMSATTSDGLVFGFGGCNVALATGSGYTERENEVFNVGQASEDKNIAAPGTHATTFTFSGATRQWAVQGVVFGTADFLLQQRRVISY